MSEKKPTCAAVVVAEVHGPDCPVTREAAAKRKMPGERSGPAAVATEEFREGWDRIWGPPVVGKA